MTRSKVDGKGEGMIFSDIDEARRAYDNNVVELQTKAKVRVSIEEIDEEGNQLSVNKLVDTTVGRALLSTLLPTGLSFDLVNRDLTKKAISNLVNSCYRVLGLKETVIFADRLMYTGFRFATIAGISIGVDDMVIPESKNEILNTAETDVKEIQDQYSSAW